MNYEWVPDEEFLEDVCPFGQIPLANQKKFKERVKTSIGLFLSRKAVPRNQKQNEAIENLHDAVKAALKDIDNKNKVETVISRYAALPEKARDYVEEWYTSIPTKEAIENPATSWEVLDRLFWMTSLGTLLKSGRKRPGGKQSRAFRQTQLKRFILARGQPKKISEMLLVGGLMDAYEKATGRKAFVRREPNPGPYMEMAKFVYEVIGENTGLDMKGPEHISRLILERIKEDEDE